MTEHKFRINISTDQFTPSSYTRNYYYITMIITLVMAISVIALLPYLPKTVPLFYTQPWGEGRLAPKTYLLLLPAISVLFTIINLAIGRSVKDEMVLSRTIAAGNLLMTILLSISLLGIVQSII